MKENLTKIEDLRSQGMIYTEQVEILLELLLLYIDGAKGISPLLSVILEKVQKTSRVFEKIEMML